ncbi:LysR family transcriptional regulator [Leifsonia aquatica]|uniref:LysR family transcriptional regulator n=1 Tax=Leifsonia aquatica TaxID=144185 RepID=UPI0004689078|nr:LysR family transcriptional regulator [Leifsonia aquatica]
MLNLHRLAILAELESRGTLAAVADALSYSPSAVSQQLTQLERECGAVLLEPIGRGVRLTDAAHILVRHAREAIAQLELAESELAAVQDRVGGVLRVATFQTVLLSGSTPVLADLRDRHPGLRVDVAQREAHDATAGLLSGDFDLVLGEEYDDNPQRTPERIDRVDLCDDELRLAVPEVGPLAGTRSLAELASAPWATDPVETEPGRWLRALCRGAGFDPDVRFDGVDLLTHVHVVRAGLAVTVLPDLLGEANTRGVARVRLPGRPRRRLFTLTRATRAAHPAVQAYRDALARALGVATARPGDAAPAGPAA